MFAHKGKNRRSSFRNAVSVMVALGAVVSGSSAQATESKNLVTLQQGNTATTQFVTVPVNKAVIIKLPDDVRDVIIANPELVDVVVRTSKQIYLFAKKAGQTNAFFFNDGNKQILNLEINIGWDHKELDRIFKEQIPESNLKVSSLGETIILSGTVRNGNQVKLAKDITVQMTGNEKKVINNISISGQEQVMIKVKVAEMQRSILKQLGIDWNTAFQIGNFAAGLKFINGFGANGTPLTGLTASSFGGAQGIGQSISIPGIGNIPGSATLEAVSSLIGVLTNENSYLTSRNQELTEKITELQGSNTVGSSEFIQQYNNEVTINSQKIASNNQALIDLQNRGSNITGTDGNTYTQRSMGYTGNNFSLDNAIKALERHSLVKTLAEPTLTSLSGESAKFLAGGEIPYVVSGTLGQSFVEFKPYGIGLAFTPMVLSENRISLKVSTEVSELSAETVVSETSSYPGISVRRAETTVEMPSGGSIVMAGLIQENTRRAMDSTPGVKEVPILGPLFRSNDFKTQESELIILATPYLVEPAHADKFKMPTDGYVNPSDADLYWKGNMAAVYGKNNGAASSSNSSSSAGSDGSPLSSQVVE